MSAFMESVLTLNKYRYFMSCSCFIVNIFKLVGNNVRYAYILRLLARVYIDARSPRSLNLYQRLLCNALCLFL